MWHAQIELGMIDGSRRCWIASLPLTCAQVSLSLFFLHQRVLVWIVSIADVVSNYVEILVTFKPPVACTRTLDVAGVSSSLRGGLYASSSNRTSERLLKSI